MGPLHGVKVIEMVGLGPGPLCAMLLADMGAEVIRVDRPGGNLFSGSKSDLLGRNRRSLAVDLKHPDGVATVLRLVERADALIEGFRPGVMERLGLGPDRCLARNGKLIYGRMTGWGQDGPLAQAAGHDINYIALAGVLHAIGEQGGRPVPPLNLVGDFGGGGMFLAFGIVCALLEAQRSGLGQVIDCSMVEGSAVLMGMFYAMQQAGRWQDERGRNMLDGASHFYGTYETADGKWVAVGAIEPQFYATLIRETDADPQLFENQHDADAWPRQRAELARIFRTKTRDAWCALLEGSDACFAPVLSLTEAPQHPHNVARGSFVEVDGMLHPGPAPRFSRTPAQVRHGPRPVGADSEAVLADWGFDAQQIRNLLRSGAVTAA
ncbi:CaiB/BaiF CoA transferase family protein [Immundisolibacter sp.]|uniref:CaiB/BaiF CoA transferase family protein n=1 Tax=Immundisolibacter sp. TaxID=1934948 RepID=UPI000EDF3E47|nr:carnitine dehydratase [Gammaproteobacteria bacterium]